MNIIIADSDLERSILYKDKIKEKFSDAIISLVDNITSLIRLTDQNAHNLLLIEAQVKEGGAFYALRRIRDRIDDRKIKRPIWIYGNKKIEIPFSYQNCIEGEVKEVIRSYAHEQLEQICQDIKSLRI